MTNGAISIGLLAYLAHCTRSPMIFPSLGSTAFLIFHEPLATASCPRNVLLGHTLAIAVGLLVLLAMGLGGVSSDLSEGIRLSRIVAAGLSMALTSGLMVLLDISHPPAASTTLIVSLGLMNELWQMPFLACGIGLIVLQGFAFNRLVGIRYPLWENDTHGKKPLLS